MGYGKLGNVAVVCPAPGCNVTTQLHRNLHPDIGIFSIPVKYDEVTCQGIQAMSDRTVDAVKLFAPYHPDMVFFGCTTGSLIGVIRHLSGILGSFLGTTAKQARNWDVCLKSK